HGSHVRNMGIHESRATAALFEVGRACLFVAPLRALQDRRDALQIAASDVRIKRQCAGQCVGGVAHLAQRERQASPPASVWSDGLKERLISLDGKTARGSRDGEVPGQHLVAAYCAEGQAVLGQIRVGAKTYEHKAALQLLGIVPVKGNILS